MLWIRNIFKICCEFATIIYMKNDFCERLKDLRIKNKVTLRQLSSAINVDHSTISRWENGEITPSINYLKNLCVYFDVSADYLLGLTDKF